MTTQFPATQRRKTGFTPHEENPAYTRRRRLQPGRHVDAAGSRQLFRLQHLKPRPLAQTAADADPVFSTRPQDDPLPIFRFVRGSQTAGSAAMKLSEFNPKSRLTEKQAAAAVGVTPQTIRCWRQKKLLPFRVRGITYLAADLQSLTSSAADKQLAEIGYQDCPIPFSKKNSRHAEN